MFWLFVIYNKIVIYRMPMGMDLWSFPHIGFVKVEVMGWKTWTSSLKDVELWKCSTRWGRRGKAFQVGQWEEANERRQGGQEKMYFITLFHLDNYTFFFFCTNIMKEKKLIQMNFPLKWLIFPYLMGKE